MPKKNIKNNPQGSNTVQECFENDLKISRKQSEVVRKRFETSQIGPKWGLKSGSGSAMRSIWLNTDPHPSGPHGSVVVDGVGQNTTPLERQQLDGVVLRGSLGCLGRPLGRFGARRASKACARSRRSRRRSVLEYIIRQAVCGHGPEKD